MSRCGPGLLFATLCALATGWHGAAAAEGLLGGAPATSAPAGNTPAAPQAKPAAPAAPPAPGSPTALVRTFYDGAGLELASAPRDDFVDPARTVLDDNDRLEKSGQGECLDPAMAFDTVTDGKAEMAASLKTLEAVKGDEAKVVVAFVVAGNPHRLEWKLKRAGGRWKIADLLSVTGEWALSQYQCQ